jgi:branched-chain amino acid transport system permease protein
MAAALLVLPFLELPLVASEILILGMAAVAANLLIGYAGMLSFGQAMFFGVGAYAAGLLVTKLDAPMLPAIAAATLLSGLAALAVGALCVRRTGLYFLMLTFAFNQMFYFAAYSLSPLTGGEDGLPGVDRPAFLADQRQFYVFVVLVFGFQLAVMKRIVDSPTGRILQAIRDNSARAAAVGYNVQHYRLIAFTISGLMTGMAGALFAFVFEFVPIDKIHWSFSGDIIFMTLAGGSTYFLGPVAGAALYTVLQETVSIYWKHWPLVIGVVFAAVILFARTGTVGLFVGLARKVRRRRMRNAAVAEGAG